MSFITWKDVLSTGIKEIDEQHKDIVELINEFYDLSNKSGVQKQDLIEAFNKIIDHTIAHFTYEEELLEKQSIREKDIHAEAHEKFINNIFKLKDDFEQDGSLIDEVFTLLHDWLFVHILHEDRIFTAKITQK